MRPVTYFMMAACAFPSLVAAASEAPAFRVNGKAWSETGKVVQASDTLFGAVRDPVFGEYSDMSGATVQSVGAQMGLTARLMPGWTAGFGVGAYRATHAMATHSSQTHAPPFYAVSLYKVYVSEARLTWSTDGSGASFLGITAGNFSYVYNRDAHNLGAYLLRGPVYPGLLMSGFKADDLDTSRATHTGFRIQHALGEAFEQNLLLLNERHLPPTFDWSLAYVAKYRPMRGIEVGGGVNFYRVMPYSRELSEVEYAGSLEPSGDTVTYSHQGTKLMALFSVDFKNWLELPRASPRDLRLYGEAALIGVRNYGAVYDDPLERLPVTLGFNIPTLGLLDLFSVEVEWYGSPYRNDLANIGNPSAIVADWMTSIRPVPTPLPVTGPYAHSSGDDWKWSVLLEKTVARHVQFTAQVANDHYRPSPVATDVIFMSGGTATALTAPEDWYYMARLGFFF